MLRLVNRARSDPAGEDLLHGTNYGESPAPPLAYSTQLGRAAQNHTEWMGANRNHPLMASSFHHAEVLDDGTSGEGQTIGWTADSFTDRIRYTGYSSNWKGENILKRNSPTPMSVATMESNHAIWWNSSGHREIMMKPDFCAFGHHAANDVEGPNPRHWATEEFAETRPTETHIFGVLYDDMDSSGDWTPRDAADPMREGLGAVPISVLFNSEVVASSETMDNGAFAINTHSGTYDIVFGYDLELNDVRLGGQNLNLGDLAVMPKPGDADRDLLFGQRDLVRVLQHDKYLTGQPATWGNGDWTGDGLFDQADIVAAAQTDLYLKVFEPPTVNVAEAVFYEDFEDTSGFTTRGNATYWNIAPLSGTRRQPSRFVEGGNQAGKIFYGSQGYDSTATMTVGLPDLTGYTDLQLTVSLAAPSGVWEGSQKDSLSIRGSSGIIDSFRPSGNRSPLISQVHRRDLGPEFQDFNYSIENDLKSISFRFASTGEDETIGIDSVVISGEAIVPQVGQLPEPSSLLLILLGIAGLLPARR
jgi:hypothetical protein